MSTSLTMTLEEIAILVGGKFFGPSETAIQGAAPLYESTGGQITLFDQPERIDLLSSAKATAALVPVGIGEQEIPTIEVDDVHAAFSLILQEFRPPRIAKPSGVSPFAAVSPTAKLGNRVEVHPGATIAGDVVVGDDCCILAGAHLQAGCTLGQGVTIGSGAVLYENTIVGERSIIHANSVVGANGFGYRQEEGRHLPTAQLGNVVIGADVEIGAGVTIDRGTYGTTRIGDGTKVDNLVQIAHNCQIGKHNMICSQVGIAGSTSTGDYVVMGGQAGIRDHVHIGTGAILGAMAGVTNNVPDGEVMLGIPATGQREQKLKLAALAKLPQMRKQFKTLLRQMAELQKDLGESQRAA